MQSPYDALLQENAALKKQLVNMEKNQAKLEEMISKLTNQIDKLTSSLESKQPSYSDVTMRPVKDSQAPAKKVTFSALENSAKKPQKNFPAKPQPPIVALKEQEPKLLPIKVKLISSSKWIGKKFYYLVHFNDSDWPERWLEPSQFSADSAICAFHKENPGCPTADDYVDFNEWKTVQRKQRNIRKKLDGNRNLSQADIEFIAKGITHQAESPKEFKRLHFSITNKRDLRRCTYNQKITVISKVLHTYGLSGSVARISFIGDSVLEVYIQAAEEETFVQRMTLTRWNINPRVRFLRHSQI
jgi:hypothetical protein